MQQKSSPKNRTAQINKARKTTQTLSICLRDSAFALHLRHTTECVLQRVLRFRSLHSESFTGILLYRQYTPIFANVNLETTGYCGKNIHLAQHTGGSKFRSRPLGYYAKSVRSSEKILPLAFTNRASRSSTVSICFSSPSTSTTTCPSWSMIRRLP